MMGKTFAYIKVHPAKDNIDLQFKSIKKYCLENNISINEENIFIDKSIDGKQIKMDSPQALNNLSFYPKDILIIRELNDLGNDLDTIKNVYRALYLHGIELIIIENEIFNTFKKSHLENKLKSDIIYELLDYFCEKTNLTKVNKNNHSAKPIGRPQESLDTLSDEQLEILKLNFNRFNRERSERTITANQFMEILGLKRNTFYKIIKQYKEKYLHE